MKCIGCGDNNFSVGFSCKLCGNGGETSLWSKVFNEHKRTFIEPKGDDTVVVDRVNKPTHYNHNATGIECIDAIKAATGEHFEGYLQGNIIKYIWRYRYKNNIEDIQKAQVYIGWLEDYRKEKQE